jgi:hypothetical protein
MASESATSALRRLEANPELKSYREDILHALSKQQQRRRDAEYDRPNWSKTVAALTNGAPATASDLHAVLVAHMLDRKKQIERENTDPYKMFWNLDKYSRPETPRPEEACRDHLVTLMRPSLAPLGITIEPEGHMVADKRADIAASAIGAKVLCELKRDYHAEVWTAISEQLERFYTPDPDAKGFGIYCVFWFGQKRSQSIPAHPRGLSRPNSASEMERMLKDELSEDVKRRISILVIDVSGEI